MADIVEIEEVDKDTVEPEVLEQQFSKKYNVLVETAVSMKRSYVNKLHGSKSLKLAVSCTENVIEIYRLNNNSLRRECRFSGHKSAATEVVWSPVDENLVYSSGLDGFCKLWDSRIGEVVMVYAGDDQDLSGLPRPFECMDVSSTGAVICAGSQVVKQNAYIVFWDHRQPTPLGGYWNSHTKDITQVKFHKNNNEILATGSIDGLLNIFNVTEESEDDALMYTCNIENSIEKITWLDEKRVACATDSNDMQIWDALSGDLLNSYTRDKIARSIKRSREDDCYMVDTFKPTDGTPVIVAGSHGGNGKVLRSLSVTEKKLQPATNFVQNKQIVRCMWYNEKEELLVTGGESGFITVWSPKEVAEYLPDHSKISNSKKQHGKRHKPY